MKRTIGPAFLVAGTAIGAGVLALPLTLSKLGVLPLIILAITIWLTMHYCSLIYLELNLRAGKGLPLGALGKEFGSQSSYVVGTICTMLLTYSLLSAYLYGGTSIIKIFCEAILGNEINSINILNVFGVIIFSIMLFYTKFVELTNRFLFVSLMVAFITLIVGLVLRVDISNVPLIEAQVNDVSSWTIAIPVMFTSFAFHVICHTLTDYCDKNPKILKNACFYGSLIALIVYIIWTLSVIITIHNTSPEAYNEVVNGQVEVGRLIQILTQSTGFNYVRNFCWLISILAIVTSIFGVGLGLIDLIKDLLKDKFKEAPLKKHIFSVITAFAPPFFVAAVIPKAFINILAFAGMVVVILKIILPLWVLRKSNERNNGKVFFPIVNNSFLKTLFFLIGILIIGCEIYNFA
ncbi:MAG: amino acid permease [Sphingobacteriia bacterium]|nr:amino acid permease [Sphingobacteriia bacterium]